MRRSFLFNRQSDPYGTDESVQPRGIEELAYEGSDDGIAGLSEVSPVPVIVPPVP